MRGGLPEGKPHVYEKYNFQRWEFSNNDMKATGIVAEFNPLHKGHIYMMKEARRITGANAVVIAMSGNFVQRGEPAILDKWLRTRAALLNGADLVFEIPTLFCIQNAGRYAFSGVRMLESLGCVDKICCGCSAGDAEAVRKIADTLMTQRDVIDACISNEIKNGLSYPAAREKILSGIMDSEESRDNIKRALNSPNDILAIEYMMSAENSEIVCIDRVGAEYNDSFISEAEYQSAGGIRELVKEKGIDSATETMASFLPSESLEDLKEKSLVFKDDISDYLRFALINTDAESIDECPSGGEGLGNLFKEAALSNNTVEEIIAYAKSKRYTYTRLSRLCMQILLEVDRRAYPFDAPEYLRLLGFTEKGRQLLSEIKKNETNSLPIITNINKERLEENSSAERMLKLDIKASGIYNLICGNDVYANSDYMKTPIMTGY
ncbi:MAG: nucleotidyltransferase [Mogibacterium sp.]|nr:nucleotidyltransferase [Mogibacterium sp.]